MPVRIISQSDQLPGSLNGGAIQERRPVAPDSGGGHLKPYSNLFYWAYAWSDHGSTIGLHPHKGFEIMSFVIKGSIEHYDTHFEDWRTLKTGDVQIIRAGNGISHSEKINAGSAMFQIWLDPNLRESLARPASYDDYSSESFPMIRQHGIETKVYRGDNAPLSLETEGVRIEELHFAAGRYQYPIADHQILSCFLLEGQLVINGQQVQAEDFVQILDEEQIDIVSSGNSRLLMIQTPLEPSYPTYGARFA